MKLLLFGWNALYIIENEVKLQNDQRCEKYIHPMPTWFKEKITAQDIMLGT